MNAQSLKILSWKTWVFLLVFILYKCMWKIGLHLSDKKWAQLPDLGRLVSSLQRWKAIQKLGRGPMPGKAVLDLCFSTFPSTRYSMEPSPVYNHPCTSCTPAGDSYTCWSPRYSYLSLMTASSSSTLPQLHGIIHFLSWLLVITSDLLTSSPQLPTS